MTEADIISFIKEYLQREYGALIANYTERDEGIFQEKLFTMGDMKLSSYIAGFEERPRIPGDAWFDKGREYIRTLQQRPLYFIRHYRHHLLGDVFACYTGSTNKEEINNPFCFYVMRMRKGLMIVAGTTIEEKSAAWSEDCIQGARVPLRELNAPVKIYRFQKPPDELTQIEYDAYEEDTLQELPPKSIFDSDHGFKVGEYFCRLLPSAFNYELLIEWTEHSSAEDSEDYICSDSYNLVDEAGLDDKIEREIFQGKAILSSWLLSRLWYLTGDIIKQRLKEDKQGMYASDGAQIDIEFLIEKEETAVGVLQISLTPSWAKIGMHDRTPLLNCRDFYDHLLAVLMSEPRNLAVCSITVSDFEKNMHPWHYGWDGQQFLTTL